MDQIDLPQTEAQAAEQMANRYPPLFVEVRGVDQYGDPEEDVPEDQQEEPDTIAAMDVDIPELHGRPADDGRRRVEPWAQAVMAQLRELGLASLE